MICILAHLRVPFNPPLSRLSLPRGRRKKKKEGSACACGKQRGGARTAEKRVFVSSPLPCMPPVVSACSHVPAPAYRTAIAADHARTSLRCFKRNFRGSLRPPAPPRARPSPRFLLFLSRPPSPSPPLPAPLHLSDTAPVLSRSRNLCSFRGEWSESRSRAGAPRHPCRGRENWVVLSSPFPRVCTRFCGTGRRRTRTRTRTRVPCLLGCRGRNCAMCGGLESARAQSLEVAPRLGARSTAAGCSPYDVVPAHKTPHNN